MNQRLSVFPSGIETLLRHEILQLVIRTNSDMEFGDFKHMDFGGFIHHVLAAGFISEAALIAVYEYFYKCFATLVLGPDRKFEEFIADWKAVQSRKGMLVPTSTPAPHPLSATIGEKVTDDVADMRPFSKACVELSEEMSDSLGQTENVYVAAELPRNGVCHILMFNRRGLVSVELKKPYGEYVIRQYVKFERPLVEELPSPTWLRYWIKFFEFEKICTATLINRILKELKDLKFP